MAHIKCEECGNWFSSDDKSCPNCGCPIDSPEPPKSPKNNDKRTLYIALGAIALVAITSIFAIVYNDMAKREQKAKEQAEMLAKELRERQKADSIAAVQAQEEAVRKAREDSIEAALAFEEQQRIEEEERIRREGVQKTLRLNCSVYDNEQFNGSCNVSGYIYDTYTATISTHICRVPQGKVWIYKGYFQCEEMKNTYPTHRYPILSYYTKENEGILERNGKRSYYSNQTIELNKGGVPLLRPGDGISVRQQFDKRYPGDYWIEVYFVEKNEEDYY